MNLQNIQTLRNSPDTVDATGALLRDLIDYAGLFPPASLAMVPAVVNYGAYSRSEWNWVLGRFIVPVARLGEFEEALAGLPISAQGSSFAKWRLSVLFGSDMVADVAQIREFNARMATASSSQRVAVEAVELRVASPEEITRLPQIIPAELAAYFDA